MSETREKTPQELCETIKDLLAERDQLKRELAISQNTVAAYRLELKDQDKDKAHLYDFIQKQQATNADLTQRVDARAKEIERLRAEIDGLESQYANCRLRLTNSQKELELGRGKGILYGEGELGYLCNKAEEDRDSWKAKAERYESALSHIQQHMELSVPQGYELSSVWNIAKKALSGAGR